ncbi:ATP-dependent DNA ligase [Paenibacillus harenae]|uniref:DNA ligase-1 n=1 Tax=Paenibacillus harenae TaxID=306543 RepID=A0ABT9TWZ7_PAEHA|nr:ATP-dependent DNA ligase [Paenibacillus harenae]MDQ0058561.1 DNA ligase-1 [Paenibacillus harenae]MDQ0111898.1 DNA ligase-1 [Paenibacillus harenae]
MFLKPMQMTESKLPFDEKRYLFEPLIDGHRLQLSFIGNKATLYTKHHNDVSRQYPELLNVPAVQPADFVLDGEVACINPTTGETEFDMLIERFKLRKEPAIRDAKRLMPVHFYVFDVLYYNGIDMRDKPLSERKQLLQQIVENNAYYEQLPYVDGAGKALFDFVKQSGLEGIACKRKDSLYVAGDSGSWLKVKNPYYNDLHMSEASGDRNGKTFAEGKIGQIRPGISVYA